MHNCEIELSLSRYFFALRQRLWNGRKKRGQRERKNNPRPHEESNLDLAFRNG